MAASPSGESWLSLIMSEESYQTDRSSLEMRGGRGSRLAALGVMMPVRAGGWLWGCLEEEVVALPLQLLEGDLVDHLRLESPAVATRAQIGPIVELERTEPSHGLARVREGKSKGGRTSIRWTRRPPEALLPG